MEQQEPDVVPVGTFMGNHAASIAGIPLSEYYTDSQKMFDAQMYALNVSTLPREVAALF